jgi:hypothetical protein
MRFAYIPEGVAAFSEAAYEALQADRIVNRGVLGFNLACDLSAMDEGVGSVWRTRVALDKSKQSAGFVDFSDLKDTTLSTFFLRSDDPRWDRKLINWNELVFAGFTCVGSTDGLRKLAGS